MQDAHTHGVRSAGTTRTILGVSGTRRQRQTQAGNDESSEDNGGKGHERTPGGVTRAHGSPVSAADPVSGSCLLRDIRRQTPQWCPLSLDTRPPVQREG
ncbi:hypothetical protein TBR22_A37610 [Luteitalea sp. TBR-22]|nr:hypothetical protein TBR22_A37610 [Luteitalea sp. TBR-22]